jgi:hypothetical protein
LLVFLVLGLVYPTYFYDGRSLQQTKLWRFYLLELQQELRGIEGPGTGNWGQILMTLAIHVVVSAAGGGLAVGGRRLMGKF